MQSASSLFPWEHSSNGVARRVLAAYRGAPLWHIHPPPRQPWDKSGLGLPPREVRLLRQRVRQALRHAQDAAWWAKTMQLVEWAMQYSVLLFAH
jgi:hypothetical protein